MTVLDERNNWIDRLTKQVEALTKDNDRLRRVGYRDGLLRAAEICRELKTADYYLSPELRPMQRWLFLYFADAIEAEAQKIAVELPKPKP